MIFDKKPALKLLSCQTCKSTGRTSFAICSDCSGMSIGRQARGWWLYWNYPLTRYHLALQKARRLFNKVRFITVIILGVNFWFWFGLLAYRAGAFEGFFGSQTVIVNPFIIFNTTQQLLFWLGIICFCYATYRSIKEREYKGVVEHYDYKNKKVEGEDLMPATWAEVKKIPKRKRHNIADAFTAEALSVLGDAYDLADKSNHIAVMPVHLFYVLLGNNRISNIFIRLGISTKIMQNRLESLFSVSEKTKTADSASMPLPALDFWQIIFQSYDEAYNAHQDYVSVTELLLITVQNSEPLQEILYDLGIDKNKLVNVIEWARIKEKLYRQYIKFRKAAGSRSKSGMDKAMTALATPYLNQFGEDLTLLAQLGRLNPCVAREKEIEEVFRIVEGGGQNVILVGQPGAGKRSVIDGIAEKMIEEDVPPSLRDKRLVQLSVASLLAGTTASGAVERLIHIMNEIVRARNVILFINNLHELVGVAAGGEKSSLDVADTLAEYLKGNRFLTLATTDDAEYAQHISNSVLSTVFSKVDVKEMEENQAIQVLQEHAGVVEYKQGVFFAYDAIEKAVQLAKRFLHEVCLPGSALEIMNESAVFTHSKKGSNSLVTGEEVSQVVAEKTKIPVASITTDESAKLLRLEDEMHKRIVGQEEAVGLVANALRRARAEIRSSKRPIASFLFLGPTGVGKTELAKTIAQVYFGGEERMVRLDMSEYQDKTSIYRLIGSPGEKGTGILTEAVRRNPFSLVLLDEIEKADKDVINLFLQVMDDGRLTDSTGRVVDFTNVILVVTSNAGTAYVQEQLNSGIASDLIKDRLLHGELKQYFRPEFLNRFDGIVLFKSLAREDIKKIAGLMLKQVAKDLEIKGIELVIEDMAIEFLADVGFDPEFGARPMRRAIQERIENKLAELLISGKLRRRDSIVIGAGGEISVRPA